ncbi:hypothetical protein OOK31_21525 [Streptomyces sp. NBC_00249]|uniref:hypothetical protein n=1 Tax=Streptomyces sp. NBC_00249 TaxID=2975690 RepID=UPI002258ED5D|nr:hypothetical protein [Streptomyces sp. NBC_00249]MCX5196441.1 hypothetical protein [Streptomyces sp. NBC_00249]
MSDIVKHLPPAAIPEGGVPGWKVADAERWRAARVSAVLGPVAGGWILVPLVLLAVVLRAVGDPTATSVGTEWDGYQGAVLLVALPAWYRFLPPAATVGSVPLIALEAVLALFRPAEADGTGRAGAWVTLALGAFALTGALLRLRSRRIQRALVLEAAGDARRPVPDDLPDGHRHRGRWLILAGALICAAATAFLAWGLAEDLKAPAGHPYDASGQQVMALLLFAPGTPLLGRGLTARRAARRLHDGPQPVLRVGVRHRYGERNWLLADARTTTAPPLVAFRDRFEDSYRGYRGRTLVGGPEERLRTEHHDIDELSEPYEAILYGVPCEGAEILLEFAVYAGGSRIVSELTAAPLMPHRRHTCREWRPAGTSYAVRRAEDEKRRRERAESSGGSGSSSGCGSSGSCSSSCGSSCGGGCGGGD